MIYRATNPSIAARLRRTLVALLTLLLTNAPVFAGYDESNAATFEMMLWNIVEANKTPADYEAYLEIFPTGRFAEKARKKLERHGVGSLATPVLRKIPKPKQVIAAPGPGNVEANLRLTREERVLVQRGLNAKNFRAGTEDGLFGQATREAIRNYQVAKRSVNTGYLTGNQAKTLIEEGRKVPAMLPPKRATSSGQTESVSSANVGQSAGASKPEEYKFATAAIPTKLFPRPNFAVGTIFVFQKSAPHLQNKTIALGYRGKTASGYDFGKRELSASLLIKRKGSTRRINFSPIKFPFRLGDTWKYTVNFESKNGVCDISREMTAVVSKSIERVLVSGQELDVVRVTHMGSQRADCGANFPIFGHIFREFLYSPKLGIYVESHFRRRVGDELVTDRTLKMLSFSIPNQTLQ